MRAWQRAEAAQGAPTCKVLCEQEEPAPCRAGGQAVLGPRSNTAGAGDGSCSLCAHPAKESQFSPASLPALSPPPSKAVLCPPSSPGPVPVLPSTATAPPCPLFSATLLPAPGGMNPEARLRSVVLRSAPTTPAKPPTAQGARSRQNQGCNHQPRAPHDHRTPVLRSNPPIPLPSLLNTSEDFTLDLVSLTAFCSRSHIKGSFESPAAPAPRQLLRSSIPPQARLRLRARAGSPLPTPRGCGDLPNPRCPQPSRAGEVFLPA